MMQFNAIYSLKELGQILLRRRHSQNMRQRDMHLATGMSQQQYQLIEAGGDVRVSTLLRIADGLGLELHLIPREQLALANQTSEQDGDDTDFTSVVRKHLRALADDENE